MCSPSMRPRSRGGSSPSAMASASCSRWTSGSSRGSSSPASAPAATCCLRQKETASRCATCVSSGSERSLRVSSGVRSVGRSGSSSATHVVPPRLESSSSSRFAASRTPAFEPESSVAARAMSCFATPACFSAAGPFSGSPPWHFRTIAISSACASGSAAFAFAFATSIAFAFSFSFSLSVSFSFVSLSLSLPLPLSPPVSSALPPSTSIGSGLGSAATSATSALAFSAALALSSAAFCFALASDGSAADCCAATAPS
jgi:hypothetical protein